jgi:hypothetical protein
MRNFDRKFRSEENTWKATKLNGNDNININVKEIGSEGVTGLICLAIQTSYRLFSSHKMCGNCLSYYVLTVNTPLHPRATPVRCITIPHATDQSIV